jgi:hypothetical protein
MKRDMDIIRLLLLEQEAGATPPELNQYEDQLVVYNVALMIDAGLIEGKVTDDESGTPVSAVITRMTWAGHDFLDAARDPSIWQAARERILKPGISWTISMLAEFLKAEAQRRLAAALGLPPTT